MLPILIVAVFAVLSVLRINFLENENKRLIASREAAMSGDNSKQQHIDIKEFKEWFAQEVEALKEQGISARRVENVIEVHYVYKDTTIYRDTLLWVHDTLKDEVCAPFEVEAGCYTVCGQIEGDTLEIHGITSDDKILVALFKEKKKCLFERRKIKAIAISACKGDTISVIRNLKIGR